LSAFLVQNAFPLVRAWHHFRHHFLSARSPFCLLLRPQQPEEEVCEVQLRRREAFKSGERVASFASDSAASNASSAGVESFLESRKLDPETILLNLGFGGSQDSSNELGLSRIPQRFLQPSSVSVCICNQLQFSPLLLSVFHLLMLLCYIDLRFSFEKKAKI
jgi:Ki-ras-induced actin-interacting protein-IP3R-interacting domain